MPRPAVFLVWWGMADAEKRLSTKEQAFVSAYLGESRFNATKAAIVAGYSERTARAQGSRLLTDADIQAAVQAWRDEAKGSAIGQVEYRLAVLDDLERRYLALIDARQKAYADDDEAIGGDTGLLVRQEKTIGTGDRQEVIVEFKADTAITNEIRALHAQAAKELGQWTERVHHDGSVDFLAALRGFGAGVAP